MMIGLSIFMMGSAWIPSVNNIVPLSSSDPVQVALSVVDENRRVIGVRHDSTAAWTFEPFPLGPVVACWGPLSYRFRAPKPITRSRIFGRNQLSMLTAPGGEATCPQHLVGGDDIEEFETFEQHDLGTHQ